MNELDYRLSAAIKHHDLGDPATSIDYLTQLLAEDPDQAFFHGLLASCLLMQSRTVAAEYENRIALQLDPSIPYVHQVRARIFLLLRKIDDALDACNESLRLEPESASCLLLKSDVYRLQDRREDAKVCLDQALAMEPDRVSVQVALGDFYNSTGNYNLADYHASEALRMDPQSVSANVLMGELQLARGNFSEADYHAKFSFMQNPHAEDALRLFANIRMRNNWFIGLWWRFNNWISTLGAQKSALVLIAGFLGFNVLSEIAYDLGYPGTSGFLSYAWLVIVLYSWVGLPMYHRTMKKELQSFQFDKDF